MTKAVRWDTTPISVTRCFSRGWLIRSLALMGLGTSLLVGTVAAQETTLQTDLSPIQVTAGKQAQSITEANAAVSAVDADAWDMERPAVLPELLENLPGVFVQQTTPGQGVAIVRGLKGSEVLHLVDGMRLNFGFFRNAPNQYLALVDPNALSRVEVVRGPSSSLYGSDAMGGVINMISVQPQVADGDHTGAHAAIGGQTASADDSISAHGRVGYRGTRFAATLGAGWRDHDDRTNGDGDTLPFTGYESESADAALLFQPHPSQQWRLSLQHLRQPSTPRHDQMVAGFGQSEPDRSEFYFEPSQRDFAHVSAGFDDLISSADRIDLHLAWQQIIDDTRRRSFGSSNRDFEENRSNLLGFTLDAQDALTDTQSVQYGLESYYDRINSEKYRVNLDDGSVSPRESRFPDDSTMRTLAAYVQHQADWDTQHWQLGLRVTNVRIDLAADGSRPAARLEFEDVSGNLGGRFDLGSGYSLHTNLGRGFRTPNIFDLGAIGPRPSNRFNAANPDLGPEVVYSADLGVKWSHAQSRGEFFLWWSEYRDKIVSVFTGEQTDAGEDIVRSENVGRVSLRGAESQWVWFFARSWNLDLVANTTWGAEKIDGRYEPADRIPPATASVALEHRTSAGHRFRLRVASAGAQTRLSQRDQTDSRINPEGTAGWATVGVSALFHLPAQLDLTLAVENALGTSYRKHASGVDAPGLDARAGFRWRFGAAD